jgi:hypothetical protein
VVAGIGVRLRDELTQRAETARRGECGEWRARNVDPGLREEQLVLQAEHVTQVRSLLVSATRRRV